MERTVLIGLDGATFTVLDPLLRDGHMPFLREFVSRGVRATLLSTPNALTPPAWTSMVTGRMPGRHGIFDFIRAEETAEGFYFTLNMSYDIRCETLWSAASRQGKTVTAMNFPVACPPEPVNGFWVPGFVHWRNLRRSVHPPDFYGVMQSVPGFDAKQLSLDMNEELKSIQYLEPEQYEPWIAHHRARERQIFNLVRHVLTHSPTDLTAVVFDGADKLQHLCWRFLDPQLAPTAPTPWEAKIRGLCLEYFRQLDGFLCDLVALAGQDARVFVASDHGFGPTTDLFFANAWLARQGYLRWTDGPAEDLPNRIAIDRIKNHVVGIDWEHTVAFALTPSSNGIYIRRPSAPGRPGVPEADYPRFRAELAARLLALRHPETGRRIVRGVLTREEAFPGAAAQRAPDLTLVMEDYGFLSVLNSEAVVKPRGEPWGTHYPEGVFIAAGTGVESGASVGPLSIVDVAPALLYSLGLPLEPDMDGRLAAGVFRPDFLQARPPTFASPRGEDDPDAGARPGPGDGSSPEAEAAVLDHLRALGYLAS